MTEILVALITGGLALLGVIITGSRNAREIDAKLDKELAVMRTEMENLTGEVRKHNGLMERTYKLEGQMTEAQHDIRDLKEQVRGKE